MFSSALGITIIIGIYVGGFGIPYEELKVEKKLYNFLEVHENQYCLNGLSSEQPRFCLFYNSGTLLR